MLRLGGTSNYDAITYTQIHTHTRTHTRTHARMHAHTHTHTHARTHTHGVPWDRVKHIIINVGSEYFLEVEDVLDTDNEYSPLYLQAPLSRH